MKSHRLRPYPTTLPHSKIAPKFSDSQANFHKLWAKTLILKLVITITKEEF